MSRLTNLLFPLIAVAARGEEKGMCGPVVTERRSALPLTAALVALILGLPAFSNPKPAGVEIHTKHYDLYVEGMDAHVAGELVEELYAKLAQLLGAEPHQRLPVKIVATHEGLVSALKADGFSPEPNDMKEMGRYRSPNHTAYVCGALGPFFLQETLLHECTHQFHFLVRGHSEENAPRSSYYFEGLAEHFEVHRWDGHKADFGALPDITQTDIPRMALYDLKDQHHNSIRALAIDPTLAIDEKFNYGSAWGLVSFLLDTHKDQYVKWAALLDGYAEPAAAWDKTFGKDSDTRLSQEYLDWLNQHQRPWITDSNGDWQSTDHYTIEAWCPKTVSIATLKHPTTLLSASVTARGDQVEAGVIVADQGAKGAQSVVVVQSGQVRFWQSKPQEVVSDVIVSGTKVRDPRNFRVKCLREEDAVMVFIDGVHVLDARIPHDSVMGLIVSRGQAVFGSLETREARNSGIVGAAHATRECFHRSLAEVRA